MFNGNVYSFIDRDSFCKKMDEKYYDQQSKYASRKLQVTVDAIDGR